MTSRETLQPVEGARVADQVSGADGLVHVAAYATVQATRRGDLPSGTIATPALPCPYTGPFPQGPSEVPAEVPPATPAPAATSARPSSLQVTLEPAGTLRPGRLRFTATSTGSGTFQVVARIGPTTVRRSVTFRAAGALTFSLRPTARQTGALRRAVRRRGVRVQVRLSGQGTTVAAVGPLRR